MVWMGPSDVDGACRTAAIHGFPEAGVLKEITMVAAVSALGVRAGGARRGTASRWYRPAGV